MQSPSAGGTGISVGALKHRQLLHSAGRQGGCVNRKMSKFSKLSAEGRRAEEVWGAWGMCEITSRRVKEGTVYQYRKKTPNNPQFSVVSGWRSLKARSFTCLAHRYVVPRQMENTHRSLVSLSICKRVSWMYSPHGYVMKMNSQHVPSARCHVWHMDVPFCYHCHRCRYFRNHCCKVLHSWPTQHMPVTVVFVSPDCSEWKNCWGCFLNILIPGFHWRCWFCRSRAGSKNSLI